MFIGRPNVITIATGIYNKVNTLKRVYVAVKDVRKMNSMVNNVTFDFIDKEVFKRKEKEQPKTDVRCELKVVNGRR